MGMVLSIKDSEGIIEMIAWWLVIKLCDTYILVGGLEHEFFCSIYRE